MGRGQGAGLEAAVLGKAAGRGAAMRGGSAPRLRAFLRPVNGLIFRVYFSRVCADAAFKSPTLVRTGTSLLTGGTRVSMPARSAPVGIGAGSGSGAGVASARGRRNRS